jgi:hypothetical protein
MREYLIQRTDANAEPIQVSEALSWERQSETFDNALVAGLITAARQDAETITRRALVAQRWTYLMDQFPRPGFNVGSANWYGPQWGVNPGPLTVLSPDGLTGYEIYLPLPPTLIVESITYIDSTGAPQTLDPSQYLTVFSTPCCITPAFGTVWPETQMQKAAVQVKFTAGYAAPATADATANTITAPLWTPLNVGDQARLSCYSDGALPAPLNASTDYFVQSAAPGGVYTLSLTSGGSAIDLTTAGTGQIFIGVVPEGIKRWMKVRVGTLYENREEVAILNRGKLELLPYVDRLLDPFRVLSF